MSAANGGVNFRIVFERAYQHDLRGMLNEAYPPRRGNDPRHQLYPLGGEDQRQQDSAVSGAVGPPNNPRMTSAPQYLPPGVIRVGGSSEAPPASNLYVMPRASMICRTTSVSLKEFPIRINLTHIAHPFRGSAAK
jgi:hypothetical protein